MSIRALLLAATAALVMAAAPASATNLDDNAEATIVTMAHIDRAAHALHPDGDYSGISTAQISEILETPYIRQHVGLAMTSVGDRPVDGWGAGIEILPSEIDRHGKARAFTIKLVSVPGDACDDIAKAVLGGSKHVQVGETRLGPKATRRAVACRSDLWDSEGEIDVAITLR